MNQLVYKHTRTFFRSKAVNNVTFSNIFSKSISTESKLKHKNFVEWAATQLNVKKMSDWYDKSGKDLLDIGGEKYLRHYGGSYINMLTQVYPEHDWLIWKFSRCPKSYWEDLKNQRKFMDWIAIQKNYKSMDDWYNLTHKELSDLGGGSLLLHYNGSVIQLLMAVYSEYDWKITSFATSPRRYWDDQSNQKEFLEKAKEKLNVKTMSDWYNVTGNEIKTLGGGSFLVKYKDSMYLLLSSLYPEYDWLPWKFMRAPKNIWDKPEIQRKYLDWAFKEMKFKDMSDWYKCSFKHIDNLYGRHFADKFKSLAQLLGTVYPEYLWLPWRFEMLHSRYWEQETNWKNFMNQLGNQFKIKELSDWFNVTPNDVIEVGGGIILLKYDSLSNALQHFYPDFDWKNHGNTNIWQDENLANRFLEWLKKSSDQDFKYFHKLILQLEKREDSFLLQLLSETYADYKWRPNFQHYLKKSQYLLKECLKIIFPGKEMIEDYRHPDIFVSNKPLELDIFYPDFNLAFEHQGQQHFKEINIFHRNKSFAENLERDQTKAEICKEKGITLIKIPYWWDKKKSSLYATIYNSRPDLLEIPPKSKPISTSPPVSSAKTIVPKKYLMTATEWDENNMEPKGWWMSEKFDGMRMFWDGSQFFTRHGEKVNVPVEITSQLPRIELDGELWTQYGIYQEAVGLARSNQIQKWNSATFWVFDSPQYTSKPFEERIEFIKQFKYPSFVKIMDFVKCEGKEHLKQYYSSILAKGGEGVMLREPNSLYKSGRSQSLRKFKPFSDTEVKVIKNQYPHGFLCEQINGKVLFVNRSGSDTLEEAKKVQEGSVITVKHLGVNAHGTLQYPQFYRERLDLRWEDLINS